MNTVEFLRAVLPTTGLFIIARLSDRGFRHQVCSSIEEAAAYALSFDQQGVATYHACAAYREAEVVTTRPDGAVWRQVRVHKNVRALRAFYMDLDVKPGVATAYESQDEAVGGLVDFISKTELPMPMVVSSGFGIHVYWTLTDEILPEVWKQTASSLKALAIACGLRADHACTADPSRVLRPIGTFNRKDERVPRAVELVVNADGNNFGVFGEMVLRALKHAGVKAPVAEAVRAVESPTERINQAFEVQQNFPPCSGARVAERCKQLATLRDSRGNVPEPHWYAGIQLLCHSVEGDALIHEWSKGYAGYSETETNNKINQVRRQRIGPTLCNTFAGAAPGGCDGCPFQGKISSPAQLGTIVTSAPAPVVSTIIENKVVQVTLPTPPIPFTRMEGGGICVEEDGITHKIYEYDFYPTEMAWDEALGYETTRFKHWLPHEGWQECIIQSSLLARPVDFESKLRDHHIQPLVRNKMAQYGDAYLRKLKTVNKMRKLFKTQGWKSDDTEFVLGEKLYSKGTCVQAGVSQGAERFMAPFHSKGSLDVWRQLTWVFNTPGFEPHAFMLLLAFATPLLKLAGFEGFTVCALGTTGIGKSTMAQMMSSVYGHPKQAWAKGEDTKLARMQRFGAHYSMPVYMDEATTIHPKELRELIYQMPTGTGRDSMTREYKLRAAAEWATIFVTTSNDSLQSKLQLEKQNAEAEGMRLFEFNFPSVPAFGPIADIIPAVVGDNYGVAGEAYVQQLVNNRDAVKLRVGEYISQVRDEFHMAGKERFWSQAIALALYGGELARAWGIIDFDPNVIKPWLQTEVRRMRGDLRDNVASSVAIFGQYLDAHIGERLVVSSLNAGMTSQWQKPTRELSQRLEKDSNTLFISRHHLKHWLELNHFSYNDLRDDFIARGILVAVDTKKVLGAGTDMAGAQVVCWKIKASHSELAGVVE